MSSLTGKCDLFDHLSMEALHDVPNSNIRVSDIMECFKIFHKNTGGVIYQHKKVKVTPYNQDLVAQKCDNFEIITHTEEIPDRRTKTGTKTKTTYTYKFWGKEYTSLSELNKHTVWIKTEIRFNNLLELIPWLPYIIAEGAYTIDKEVIYIGKHNYAERHYEEMLNYGYDSELIHDYRARLAKLYWEVSIRYYNPVGRERCEYLTIKDGIAKLPEKSKGIDDFFTVTTTSGEKLKVIDSHTIDCGDLPLDQEAVGVNYVEKQDDKLYLE